MRLLLVEDDDAIATPLVSGLQREGYEVHRTASGEAALRLVEEDPPDLVLLDLGLPDLDGRAVCRGIRDLGEIPIIVVSARTEEIDRVMLLELGADDYVVKPFGFRELAARIVAVTRRLGRGSAPRPDGPQQLGPLSIDRRRRKVLVDGEEVSLTPKEHDLLVHLADDPGAVCGREDILHAVWDEHWWGPTRTLDVHIAALRRKLGRPELIETVRGVGFRLAVDADEGGGGDAG